VRALHGVSMIRRETSRCWDQRQGKSTLMKCVMAWPHARLGQSRPGWKDHDYAPVDEEIVNLGVAMVPEGGACFPGQRRENLLLVLSQAARPTSAEPRLSFEIFPSWRTRPSSPARSPRPAADAGDRPRADVLAQAPAGGRASVGSHRSCLATIPRSGAEGALRATVLMAEQNFTRRSASPTAATSCARRSCSKAEGRRLEQTRS